MMGDQAIVAQLTPEGRGAPRLLLYADLATTRLMSAAQLEER